MRDILDIDELKEQLQQFADVRDWNQFHNPKNLSMSLACEAGELLEIFRWMPENESSRAIDDAVVREQTALELADICINLVRVAGLMGINLSDSVKRKLAMIDEKYPADKVRGSSKKYYEYRNKD